MKALLHFPPGGDPPPPQYIARVSTHYSDLLQWLHREYAFQQPDRISHIIQASLQGHCQDERESYSEDCLYSTVFHLYFGHALLIFVLADL
jgi:hypothetical protein